MAKGLVFGGLNGGAGSNIKSIQRGEVVISPTANIAINAVDVNKSIVKISVKSNNATTVNAQGSMAKAAITSPTNLNISRVSSGTIYTITVSWVVIEFENVKSLQKGDLTLTTTSSDVAINPVDLSKSLCFFNFKSNHTGEAIYTMMVEQIFFNQSTLRFLQLQAQNQDIHWQVIEFK